MAKILIIDDSNFIRAMLASNLKKFGHEIIEADSGEAGIIAATTKQPALILLDIMMPGADGFAVLTELKQDVVTRDIPVIMVTSQNKQEYIVRAISLGACDYMVKPFDMNLLIAKLRKVLGGTETK